MQRAGGLLGQLRAGRHLARPGLHGLDRGFGTRLYLADEIGDLLGGSAGALGQLADLVGDDGKALALFACSGRLDGRVERQQVGLLGNVVDGLDDRADLLAFCSQLCDLGGRGFDGHLDSLHAAGRLVHGQRSGCYGRIHAFVQRRHLLRVVHGLSDRLRRRVERSRSILDADPGAGRAFADLFDDLGQVVAGIAGLRRGAGLVAGPGGDLADRLGNLS